MPRFILHALLAAICASGLGAAEPDIAVVYVERVFENSTMVRELQQDLQKKASQVNAMLDKISGELEALQDELDTLPESAPAHAETKERFEVLRLRRKLFVERSQKALQNEEVKRLKASYLRMREQLDAYATEQGYRLVLMAQPPQARAQHIQELNLELATHGVLYHAPDFDITEGFTAYFNAHSPSLEPAAIEVDDATDDDATGPEIDLGIDPDTDVGDGNGG